MAVLLAAQIGTSIACTSSPVDGSGGNPSGDGGSTSGGGNPSGDGGSTSGGGSGGVTGNGGGPIATGCIAITIEDDGCVCERSLDDFCRVSDCSLPDTLVCGSANFSAVVFYEGCGYVNRSSSGEEESTEIWSKETGELVFRRARYWPASYDICPTMEYGEAPECDAWEPACDLGPGGMGGMGGMGGLGDLGGDAP